MEFPEPVIEIAIEPKSKADQEKLGVALAKLAAEDPSFRVSTDQESGQTILKGMGELHLDIKVDILRRTYKVDANIGAPQVAYRERLTKRVEIDHTHKKQTGGTGQFARVIIIFEPNEPGAGKSSNRRSSAAAVPKEFIPGVEKGINSVMGSGVLAGFPVVDVKATLIDGGFHDVDSSVLAFEIAARAAFREALQKGGSVLLEPIMKVEVDDAGGLHRLGHGRSARPARAGAGTGHARQCGGHQCDGAARQHVRLRQSVAVLQPGPRQLTRCNSIITSRSPRAKPRRCRRNTPEPRAEARANEK